MNTWAVLAAKEAAISSGLGAGIVPAIGASSLDGFAIGALMSGTCILMLTSPRRGRRHDLAASSELEAADDRVEIAVPSPEPDESDSATRQRRDVAEDGGYRSRHRLPDQGLGPRQPGSRRSSPRHAAPPASFSSRMTGRIAVRALVGGARS
jgi:hypothetical protein